LAVHALLSLPPGLDPLVHRAEVVARYGTSAFDLLRPVFTPHEEVTVAPLIVPLVQYRTPDDLPRVVRATVRAVLDAAERPARLEYADYHAFHSQEKRDLVVRFRPGRHGRTELLFWDAERGYELVADGRLDPAQRRTFARDAILRAASIARGNDDHAQTTARLREALAFGLGGDHELLSFLPWLSAAGLFSLAASIAEAHVVRHPEDAEGWCWLGRAIILSVAAGMWSAAHLAQAAHVLAQARARRHDYAEAEIALADLARLRGDHDEAQRLLEGLRARDPDHAEAIDALTFKTPIPSRRAS
jgi:hypothetical protein